MADKDFAHIESAQFDKDSGLSSSSKSVVITLLATVFAIICFGTGFYMGEKHGIEASKGNKQETLIAKLETQKKELEVLKEDAQKWQQQEANTSQVGELTFYNELPDQSINPEPLDIQPKIKNNTVFLDKLEAELAKKQDKEKALIATEQKLEDIIQAQLKTTSRTFKIQVASFTTKADAQRFLPKLKALGIPAEIQRVEISGRGIYYRVYSRSYQQEQEAIQAKKLIKQKLNIDGLMIQNG